MSAPNAVLERFAAEVGPSGPVAAEGGRTHWGLGGPLAEGTRLVRAPSGIVEHLAEEMIVRVLAGTPVAELDARLAERGQFVALDPAQPQDATVGGVLASGMSGLRRLRWGPVRDTVLEVRYVSAAGTLVRAGAPVVKNVSGFDLCRLMVGSLGTLGLLAEVVLRVMPTPATSRWLRGPGGDPRSVLATLYRPSAVLWDGKATWVLLEGHPGDVEAQRDRLAGLGDFTEVDGPPVLPIGRRLSVPARQVLEVAAGLGDTSFVAELGVATLHTSLLGNPRDQPADDGSAGPASGPGGGHPAPSKASTLDLNHRVKGLFDPDGRLNPGRRVA